MSGGISQDPPSVYNPVHVQYIVHTNLYIVHNYIFIIIVFVVLCTYIHE